MDKGGRNLISIKKIIAKGSYVVLACGISIGIPMVLKEEKYEISTISTSYAFDHDDYLYYLREVDYVFTGEIEEIVGTDYKDKDEINGKKISTPYTKYRVNVLKSIKGDVSKGEEVLVTKLGGLSENKEEYYLLEEDNIPKERECYIFMAYAQENGELLVAGKNSTIETNAGNTTKIGKTIEKLMPKAKSLGDTPREHYKRKRN